MIHELRGYLIEPVLNSADQRPEVELDQSNMGIKPLAFTPKRVGKLLCKPALAVSLLVGFNPFHQAAIVDSDKMNTIRRCFFVEGLKNLVEQFVGRAAIPGCGTIEVDLDFQAANQRIVHATLRTEVVDAQL
ncbi:hypothetical protein ES708_17086 [subsurface metagenome]